VFVIVLYQAVAPYGAMGTRAPSFLPGFGPYRDLGKKGIFIVLQFLGRNKNLSIPPMVSSFEIFGNGFGRESALWG